jgi:hypothetical protein
VIQNQFGFRGHFILDPMLGDVVSVENSEFAELASLNASITVAIPSSGDIYALQQAIHSVEHQATGVVDVLVFDDSPEQMIDATALRCGIPIRVVHSMNADPVGAGVARQVLWEQAQSDVVVFMDDDMLLSDGCLRSARLAQLSSKTGPYVVAFPLVIADAGGAGISLSQHSTLRNLNAIIDGSVELPANLLARHNVLLAVATRTRWQFDINFVDSLRGQDSAFAGSLARAGARVVLSAHNVVVHVGPTTSARPTTEEGGTSYFEVRQLVGIGHNPGHARAHVPALSRASWAVPMAAVVVHTGTVSIAQLRSSLLELLTAPYRDFIAHVCDCVPSSTQLRADLIRQSLRGDGRFVSRHEYRRRMWESEWVGWWAGEVNEDFWDLLSGTYGTDFELQRGFEVDELDRRTVIHASRGELIRTGRLRRLGEVSPESRGCASGAKDSDSHLNHLDNDLEFVKSKHERARGLPQYRGSA